MRKICELLVSRPVIITLCLKKLITFCFYNNLVKCQPIDEAKRSFYKAANAIFGKIGRFASEEVTLHLLKTKCIPVLLYGLETLPLNKSQISCINFVINRFFMKLFNTNNIEIVKCCQQEFCFSLPSVTLAHRTENVLGKIRQRDNLLVKRLLCM